MWRRILLLDLFLVGLLVFGVVKVRRNSGEFEASHRVEAVQAEPEAARTIPSFRATTIAAGDWNEVPAKNPFSFDRNDIAVVAPKAVPPTGPKPVLFGIMSIGNESIAMLAPGQNGTRQSRAMKLGDSIETWQLVEIQKDSVVMAANGVRATIVLNDPAARIARDYTRTAGSGAAPQVVISSPPASATSPPSASTTPPPPPPGSQPGSAAKGHWMYTPFGNTWVPDNPQ